MLEVSDRQADTAGIRETDDTIESLGIERSYQQLKKASIVLYVREIEEDHLRIVDEVKALAVSSAQDLIVLLNKTDTFHGCHAYDVEEAVSTLLGRKTVIGLSAKNPNHIQQVREAITKSTENKRARAGNIVVTNARHHQALRSAQDSLTAVEEGITAGVPSDLVAIDIRHALHHLTEITGEVSTDDLLENIFRNFCIGK